MTGRLLDTTILIDLSRGSTDAANFVDSCQVSDIPLLISVISAMEVIAGCRDKTEVQKAKKLIADFHVLHLSPVESAKAYALMLAYSKSHGLTIPDALIAATAITQGLELASDNARHFDMISDLVVARPY
jgi:predicted nucleic acid-binding protein